MQAASHTPTAASHPLGSVEPFIAPTLQLDDLLCLDARALGRLYEQARVPDLGALRGDMRGRMLTPTILPPGWSALAVAWAGSDAFPWRGKSFSPLSAQAGRGINRVFSERLRLFAFDTFIASSRHGDFDALQLDYDLPANPFFIRPIKDELRQIGPTLFLGQAYLATAKADHLVLYFALTPRS
jgi:hypothetical protein